MLDASLRWHDSLKHEYDFLSHQRCAGVPYNKMIPLFINAGCQPTLA